MNRPFVVVGHRTDPAKAERAKELRRDMTAAERTLWQELRANRLARFHFRRQQVIAGLIVDFYCHSKSLVIEVDGPVHEQQRSYDDARDQILRDSGFTVLRFNNEQVTNDLPDVLRQILSYLTP